MREGDALCRRIMISQRHSEWFMMITGPEMAAVRRVSKDTDVRKPSKPGNA